MLLIFPVIFEPTGWLMRTISHGFGSVCFKPRETRRFTGSMSRIWTSTSCPTSSSFDGMRHPLRPRHLGDVDQALDAALDLDERAVVGEAHDLALDARVERQPLAIVRPRVRHDLLHAERHALALGSYLSTTTFTRSPTFSTSDGCPTRPHDMSVTCRRPSMPPRSTKRRSR
jgi:hypothetical protein